jgi:long-subunit acyl-CoA synthetase (AMP-forming)
MYSTFVILVIGCRCVNGLNSGAAPLSMETIRFLRSIGIIVSEIYGQSPAIPSFPVAEFLVPDWEI